MASGYTDFVESGHPKTPLRRIVIVGVCVAVIAAAGGFQLGRIFQPESRPAATALVASPEPVQIPEFSLLDSAGDRVSRDSLRGRWSLLFFGFANCPHICPNTLYKLDRVHQALSEAKLDDCCQVVFVSVDPERDTPEKLAEYIAGFNPAFRAFTGPHRELGALTSGLGVAYELTSHEPGSRDYDVIHSTSIIVIDPELRLRGAFPPPHDPARISRELKALVDAEA